MKTHRYLLVLVLSLSSIFYKLSAQTWVTIPDANFVSALQDIIPDALIGNQLNTESPIVAATYSLDVGGHGITNLFGIQYFSSLVSLQCQNNGLYTLPKLPESLKELYCNSNQLTALPTLSSSLTILDCSSNQLSNLPILPASLKNLSCAKNKLTTLPNLPRTLTDLICSYNKIICFPILPNGIINIDIGNNPFTCLPNYIKAIENDTAKAPLCEPGNKNGCLVGGSKK
jgi:Leucine-rich repeat (LRR) protein